MLLSGTLGTALTLPATGTKLLCPSIEIGFLVKTESISTYFNKRISIVLSILSIRQL
jgi:hypothetical protein